jgi:hypothetical protein
MYSNYLVSVHEMTPGASYLVILMTLVPTFLYSTDLALDYNLESAVHANTFRDLVQGVVAHMPKPVNNTYMKYIDPVHDATFRWPVVQLSDGHRALARLKDRASNYESIPTEAVKDCNESLAPKVIRII